MATRLRSHAYSKGKGWSSPLRSREANTIKYDISRYFSFLDNCVSMYVASFFRGKPSCDGVFSSYSRLDLRHKAHKETQNNGRCTVIQILKLCLLDRPKRRRLLRELEHEFGQEPLCFLRFLLTLIPIQNEKVLHLRLTSKSAK